MGETNKRRLYIAYYGAPGGECSSALLLMRKRPGDGGDDGSWRLERHHVAHRDRMGADGRWEAQWVYETGSTSGVPNDLRGLVYLGKVTDAQHARVAGVCSQTPVHDGDADWTCHDWTADAIDGLVAAGITHALLYDETRDLVAVGLKFALAHAARPPAGAAVATCSVTATAMISAIDGF